ncbi:MAG TPA: hypothetical protein VFM86_06115 [Pedococcus sp.]|nr:hypothetical protein [Pedococcus sp.]
MVIIGVWAAYFIQYWVRRREHLATAQSVDQFSESMRVLERRNPQPVTAAAGGSDMPATTAHAAYSQLLLRRAASSAQVPATSGHSDDHAEAAGRSREGEPAGRPAASVRRTRALVMLGALSTAVVTLPLLGLSLLPLWTLLVPVLSIAGSFGWVRASARAEQRARRAAGRPQRRAVDASESWAQERAESRAPVRVPAPAGAAAPAGVAATPRVEGMEEIKEAVEAVAGSPVAREAELYDVQAVEAAHATRSAGPVEVAAPVEELVVPARPLVDEDDIPLTWDPVPVPRPTYTMKARVTRPAPTSADLVGDADTEYAPVEDEQPVRRAAGA